MHVESYPELLDAISQVKKYLKEEDPSLTIWRRENEPDPLALDLSFQPVIHESTVESFLEPDVCTLCDRRISYKPGQFINEKDKLPYLILIHNSFILDRGRYFEDARINDIFLKMIQAGLGYPPEKFLVREVLRCYFGPEDENNPEYLTNCRKHLIDDISSYKIRGILVIGQAAPLIFGNEKKKLSELSGQITSIFDTPTLITPGPARVYYMLRKKFPPEEIQAEKKQILRYLNKFKTEVMAEIAL